jgi:hypothetical protein
MPLPSGSDLKTYLRIEHDAEDALLDDLVVSATAHAESLINRPIQATEREYSGLRGAYDEYGRTVLYLPEYPIAISGEGVPVVVDDEADTVATSEYSVDSAGRLTSLTGYSFSTHPYGVTVMVGLELDPDYPTKYEPHLRRLILGIASIDYHQRNPNASSDSSGGGVSVSYASHEDTEGLPPHLYSIVKRLRPVRIR